ncbi:MAG: hypothetical protein HC846_13115 [Blastocatellia bacterium]|nr:hypothetical protein [Blastocatellia bacterium]
MEITLTKNILRYWRNSLADSARMNIDARKLEQAERVSVEQLKSGYVSKEKAEKIVENYLTKNKKMLMYQQTLRKFWFVRLSPHQRENTHRKSNTKLF